MKRIIAPMAELFRRYIHDRGYAMNFIIYLVDGKRIAWFDRKMREDEVKRFSNPINGIGFDTVDYRKPEGIKILFKGEIIDDEFTDV